MPGSTTCLRSRVVRLARWCVCSQHVVGRFATLLLAGVEGALLGAATGSLLGALANWGIAEEQILDSEKQVQSGKHLVIAYGTAAEVARAQAILQDTAAGAVRTHAGTRAARPPEALSRRG